jgi:hypothetical protein
MAMTSATLTKTNPIALPPLPWADDALEPFISRSTIGFHYGKHHKTYVDKLNELIAGTPEADMPLEDIVGRTIGDPKKLEVLHNAQQTWNHTFYWNSMRPKGGGTPPRAIAEKIEKSFGDFDTFKTRFAEAAKAGAAGGSRRGRQTQGHRDSRRRGPSSHGSDAASHAGRLGARVLPRLSEPPEGLRRRGHRQPPELGVCDPESGAEQRLTEPTDTSAMRHAAAGVPRPRCPRGQPAPALARGPPPPWCGAMPPAEEDLVEKAEEFAEVPAAYR